MPNCVDCNAPLEADAAVCPNCRAPAEVAEEMTVRLLNNLLQGVAERFHFQNAVVRRDPSFAVPAPSVRGNTDLGQWRLCVEIAKSSRPVDWRETTLKLVRDAGGGESHDPVQIGASHGVRRVDPKGSQHPGGPPIRSCQYTWSVGRFTLQLRGFVLPVDEAAAAAAPQDFLPEGAALAEDITRSLARIVAVQE